MTDAKPKGRRASRSVELGQAKRMALRQSVAAIEALGMRLGVLAATALDGRADDVRRMVEGDLRGLVEDLNGASETAAALRAYLGLPSEHATHYASGIIVVSAWADAVAHRPGALLRRAWRWATSPLRIVSDMFARRRTRLRSEWLAERMAAEAEPRTSTEGAGDVGQA